MEEWRSIPGYPGFEASSDGRIRHITHKVLTIDPGRRQRDYPRVWLTQQPRRRGNLRTRALVHRLVALAFIGECPDGYEHNHKDGNKQNARPENLEFLTPSDNKKHRHVVLLQKINQGSKHPLAKLTETDVIAIRQRLANGEEGQHIAHALHVSESTISMIRRGKIWRHILP